MPDEPSTSSPGAQAGEEPSEAFRAAGLRLNELRDYVSHFISAKVDGLKLTARKVAIYAALGIVALLAGAAVVVSAVVLLCWGIAGAFTALFGGRVWQGQVVAGLLLLVIIGGGAFFGLNRLTKASRQATLRKYESRHQQQRANYGRDIHQAASDPAE